MQKFRASMEPFWDLKFGESVEYLTRVSSEYLTSSALPSLMSSDGQTSCVLLADIIPWIYIDSPALYIAHKHATGPVWSYTALLSSSLWLKLWNLSLLRLILRLPRHQHWISQLLLNFLIGLTCLKYHHETMHLNPSYNNIMGITRDGVLTSMGRAFANPTQVQMVQY